MLCKRRIFSNLRKAGPLAAFVLMTAMLLQVLYLMHSTYVSLPNLIDGNPFVARFQYPSHAIRRWYVIGTLFTAIAIPLTLLARYLSHRKTALAYWSFAVPTIALYLYLLIIWTMPFSLLIHYVDAMGFTSKRTYGIVCGLAGYILILVFLYWVVRRPRGTLQGQQKPVDTLIKEAIP
jgi:hypothetical protein